jgi:ABC-type multidrug transport system ATPase subunit
MIATFEPLVSYHTAMELIRCQALASRRRQPWAARALDGLDLSVAAGEVVGLVGPAGAGKTTLLRLLTGLARPGAGAAWLFGAMVPCPGRLAQVGAMIGRPGMYPWLSGRQHLQVLLASGPPGPAGAVDRALEQAGLRRLADRRVGHWPAPARRRLALATALLRQPPLLLLDEPVAGLDADGVTRVTALLAGLAGAGTTMLLVARRLGSLEPLCDRVVELEGGRLAGERPPGGVRITLDPADQGAALRLLASYRTRAEAPGVLLVGGGDGHEVNQALAGGGVYADAIETAGPEGSGAPARR